jgi:hypothetical protein
VALAALLLHSDAHVRRLSLQALGDLPASERAWLSGVLALAMRVAIDSALAASVSAAAGAAPGATPQLSCPSQSAVQAVCALASLAPAESLSALVLLAHHPALLASASAPALHGANENPSRAPPLAGLGNLITASSFSTLLAQVGVSAVASA